MNIEARFLGNPLHYRKAQARSLCGIGIFLFIALSLPQLGWPLAVPEIVAKAKPAVVEIVGLDSAGNVLKTGTGFFVSSEGAVQTNYHVIEGASGLIAKTNTGAIYTFEKVAFHPANVDVVVLKFNATDVPFLEFGRTSDLVEGQRILVIGNPVGLQGTVSDGIISAFRQNRDYIQITAPISPGSSGSPVLNEDGKVIGMATMINVNGQNLNFAISQDLVIRAVQASVQPNGSGRAQPAPPPAENSAQSPSQPTVPSIPPSGNRSENPTRFILQVNEALTNHDWQALAPNLVSGRVNYFGHRKATVEMIRKDMENDKINYPDSQSTVYPETFTHEVSNEVSPQWSGPMIYDSINVYNVVTERKGRVHRALSRLTVGYTENNGTKSIYALVMKTLPKNSSTEP